MIEVGSNGTASIAVHSTNSQGIIPIQSYSQLMLVHYIGFHLFFQTGRRANLNVGWVALHFRYLVKGCMSQFGHDLGHKICVFPIISLCQ